MKMGEKFWAWICCLLVVISYVVPYTLLTDVGAWYGSFLLWVAIALIIIVVNLLVTKVWGS